MAWSTSTRRPQLPPDWAARRAAVLARDHGTCQWITTRDGDDRRCGAPATDVDHIRPGDDHDPANLRSLCRRHHAGKSSREGAAAWAAIRRQARHPGEAHPGLLS